MNSSDEPLWVGKVQNGFLFLENGAFSRPFPSTAIGTVALGIYQGRAGWVWIGSEFGLFCWEQGKLKSFALADGFPAAYVLAIPEDAAGTIWIGTALGELWCYRDGRFADYRPHDTLTGELAFMAAAAADPMKERNRGPIVIVDEVRNARTDLGLATLGNVLPSCIEEFTATLARTGVAPSNIFYHISAAELKAADMDRLPLRAITRHPSQKDQLLSEAITLRGDLEKIAVAEAQETGEYLRPSMLIQAERVDACEPLRELLASEFGIAKDQVKISVGNNGELPIAEAIRSAKEPAVRSILTVQKLREGLGELLKIHHFTTSSRHRSRHRARRS